MRISSLCFLVLATLFIANQPRPVIAEMASSSFSITSSVMGSSGNEETSANYTLVDVVGQGTPIGPINGVFFTVEAGFLYNAAFSLSLGDAVNSVIEALIDILSDPSITLTKQEVKSVNQAIKFLEDALFALTLYEAGDDAALANGLNKIKSAINKLEAVDLDTSIYQEMLAKAAELVSISRVNEIAAIAGDTDPDIIQSRIDLAEGLDEIRNGFYDQALQSFVQAYNQALFAL